MPHDARRGRHRTLASAADAPQERPLGHHATPRVPVVQCRPNPPCLRIVGPDLDADGALARRGQELVGIEQAPQ